MNNKQRKMLEQHVWVVVERFRYQNSRQFPSPTQWLEYLENLVWVMTLPLTVILDSYPSTRFWPARPWTWRAHSAHWRSVMLGVRDR
jgi:hypothetical protein